MLTADRLYAILEQRRSELGLSQAQVGDRAFGKPDSSAFQNIRRGASPSAEKLEALARALEMEFYFGPRRPVTGAASPSGVAEPGALRPITPGLSVSGYRVIPWHSRAWKAAPQPLAFHEGLLAEFGAEIENLAVAIADDAHQLLDTRAPRTGYDRWVIIAHGRATVARLRFEPVQAIAVPDSGDPPFTVPVPELAGLVLGRVLWSGVAATGAA